MKTAEQETVLITTILNDTIQTIKSVIPINTEIAKPQLIHHECHLEFGVLIGFAGDFQSKLVISGKKHIFSSIGEKMYGMMLEGDMLTSFSGELGNMIAGGTSTLIGNAGYQIDITSPTIMEGRTSLTGFKRAIQLPIQMEECGELFVYLLVD